MSNYSIEIKDNEIYLSGDLTIQNSTDLKNEFIKYTSRESIKIRIDNNSTVDLSTIQLLISLRKNAKMNGKNFHLITEHESDLLEIFNKYGLNELKDEVEEIGV